MEMMDDNKIGNPQVGRWGLMRRISLPQIRFYVRDASSTPALPTTTSGHITDRTPTTGDFAHYPPFDFPHRTPKVDILMGLVPSERARMWKEYVAALEEERRKIQVFSKELPLCLDLVVQTIESYRKHLEERGDAGLELEEFIPMNSTSGSDEGKEKNSMERSSEDSKADWLRSAQLWSCSDQLKDIVEVDKEKKTAEDGGQSLHRKARRSWLPDLHQSFLHALDQLGGPDVATPKQIREMMNVNGLTNDEVKSHLQKYRLHSKRPRSPAITGSRQTPPIVFGVWMPPTGFAPMATATMPSVPLDLDLFDHQNRQQLHGKKRQRRTDEGDGSFFLESHD